MKNLEVCSDKDEGRNERSDQMRRRSVIYHHQHGCEDEFTQHLHNLFFFGVAKFTRMKEARALSSGPAKGRVGKGAGKPLPPSTRPSPGMRLEESQGVL